jgi:hypothetical protein
MQGTLALVGIYATDDSAISTVGFCPAAFIAYSDN